MANWLIHRLIHLMDKHKIESGQLRIAPENFSEFIILIYEGKISSTLGQQLLEKMFVEGVDVDVAMRSGQMTQIDDTEKIEDIIIKIIKNNSKVVNDYKSGKTNAIAFLIGLIMKETGGRAKVDLVKKILEEKL
ncbi:MAG: hypothetical protein NTY61_00400 [Candidatus Parcubacteria bacterium]|nr:hypothetical protein [Candidatus Parcubacteria bacterium]